MSAESAPALPPVPVESPATVKPEEPPKAGFLSSLAMPIEPARTTGSPGPGDGSSEPGAPAGDEPLSRSSEGVKSSDFTNDQDAAEKTTGGKSGANGAAYKGPAWKAFAHAYAKRIEQAGVTRQKRLDLEKARVNANASPVKTTVSKTVKSESGGGGRSGGSSGGGSKGSSGGSQKSVSRDSGRSPGGGGSKNSGGGSGSGSSGKQNPGASGSGGGKSPKSESGSSGSTGKQSLAGGKQSSGTSGASGSHGSGKGSSGGDAKSGKGSKDSPGAKGSSGAGSSKSGGSGKAGKDGKPGKDGKTPDGKPLGSNGDKAAKNHSTGDGPAPKTPLQKTRETGYKDGSRVRQIVDHGKAYKDGVRDGYQDRKAVNAKDHERLDKNHKRNTSAPTGPEIPPMPNHPPEPPGIRHDPKDDGVSTDIKPVTATSFEGNKIHLGGSSVVESVSRGELRNFAQYQSNLVKRGDDLKNVGETCRSFLAKAEDSLEKVTKFVDQVKAATEGAEGGDELNAAVAKLAEQVKVQVGIAAEMCQASVRAVDLCTTVRTNTDERYRPLYQAVVDSPLTKPGELSFYADKGVTPSLGSERNSEKPKGAA